MTSSAANVRRSSSSIGTVTAPSSASSAIARAVTGPVGQAALRMSTSLRRSAPDRSPDSVRAELIRLCTARWCSWATARNA